jgi:hypothetical protein
MNKNDFLDLIRIYSNFLEFSGPDLTPLFNIFPVQVTISELGSQEYHGAQCRLQKTGLVNYKIFHKSVGKLEVVEKWQFWCKIR